MLIHCCFFPIVTLFCGFTWLTFFVNPGLRRAVFDATIGGSWDESFGDSRYPIPDLPGASRRSTCSRNSRQGSKYARWPALHGFHQLLIGPRSRRDAGAPLPGAGGMSVHHCRPTNTAFQGAKVKQLSSKFSADEAGWVLRTRGWVRIVG